MSNSNNTNIKLLPLTDIHGASPSFEWTQVITSQLIYYNFRNQDFYVFREYDLTKPMEDTLIMTRPFIATPMAVSVSIECSTYCTPYLYGLVVRSGCMIYDPILDIHINIKNASCMNNAKDVLITHNEISDEVYN